MRALRAQKGAAFEVVVAGLNVLEDDVALAVHVAEKLKEAVATQLGLSFVFKASFDKANRTSLSGFRGVGLSRGLEILDFVKKEVQVPVVTDVHETIQVDEVAQVVDVLQVPSFLCRQTDLLLKVGASGRDVVLKRGQFASATVMRHAVDKVRSVNSDADVLVTERGLSFGGDRLVFDPRELVRLKDTCAKCEGSGHTIIGMDATHACQLPPHGGKGGSEGEWKMVPVVARAAAAVGVDALFLECYPRSRISQAPVDTNVQTALEDFPELLKQLCQIKEISSSF